MAMVAASSGRASLSCDAQGIAVAKFVGHWLEDEVAPTVRAAAFLQYEKSYRLRISRRPSARSSSTSSP